MKKMPEAVVHASFGQEVLSSLAPEIRDAVVDVPYRFALFGPDVWFMYQPWLRREGRGRRMHTTLTGEFLNALIRRARTSACRPEMFSYLAGFLCHYALDSITHPYIIYVTTQEHCFPRSHMNMEHALDIQQMRRDGVWGESHPVTGHYYPHIRLPECMESDLNEVFASVYGWPGCRKDLNRSFLLYRHCYRLLENPRGFASRLARLTGIRVLKSLAYSESAFLSLDAENLEHRIWKHPFDPSLSFSDSFPELREKALRLAVSLIESVWRYLWLGEGTEESLAALIGSNSYLSGLPADDPRNRNVPSLMPPGDEPEKERLC